MVTISYLIRNGMIKNNTSCRSLKSWDDVLILNRHTSDNNISISISILPEEPSKLSNKEA